MDSNTGIKVGLGSTHTNSNTETLKNLITASTQNVDTDNLLISTSTDKLVSGGLLVFEHGEIHVGEFAGISLDVFIAKLGTSFVFGKTNGTSSGMREDNGGDVFIIKLGILELLTTKETVRQFTTGSNSN